MTGNVEDGGEGGEDGSETRSAQGPPPLLIGIGFVAVVLLVAVVGLIFAYLLRVWGEPVRYGDFIPPLIAGLSSLALVVLTCGLLVVEMRLVAATDDLADATNALVEWTKEEVRRAAPRLTAHRGKVIPYGNQRDDGYESYIVDTVVNNGGFETGNVDRFWVEFQTYDGDDWQPVEGYQHLSTVRGATLCFKDMNPIEQSRAELSVEGSERLVGYVIGPPSEMWDRALLKIDLSEAGETSPGDLRYMEMEWDQVNRRYSWMCERIQDDFRWVIGQGDQEQRDDEEVE